MTASAHPPENIDRASLEKFNKLDIKLDTTYFAKFLIEFLFNFSAVRPINEDIRTHVNADAI